MSFCLVVWFVVLWVIDGFYAGVGLVFALLSVVVCVCLVGFVFFMLVLRGMVFLVYVLGVYA